MGKKKGDKICSTDQRERGERKGEKKKKVPSSREKNCEIDLSVFRGVGRASEEEKSYALRWSQVEMEKKVGEANFGEEAGGK